jgi:predicted MFS family arabinose efflux permease
MGWRGALQVIGILGLPLAVLAYFTLPEPARPATHKEMAESPLKSVGALLRRPAYVNLVFGASIALIGTQGFSVWAPSFLQRSFGMGLVETWIGGLTAAAAVLGTITGGLVMAWLFPRDSRWEVWLPAGMVAICVPMFLLMVFSPKVWIILALKALNSFFGAIGASVAMAAIQSFAEPHRRATAVAIALLLASLLGTGAGPYVIGYVSTALEPAYGQESLRYALLIAPAMLVWSVVHYLLAARYALHDRVN